MKTLLCFFSLLPFLVSAGGPDEIVDGNNRFAFKLLHQVEADASGNDLLFSPFSISTALAMTYAGARNETAQQIMNVMDFPQGKGFHAGYKALLDLLTKDTAAKMKLNIANGLWAEKDFKFLDPYIKIVGSNYHSTLNLVDFKDDQEREYARSGINNWVARKTNNKIKELIDQRDLSSMTRLILINAIYFYANWETPFEKLATNPGEFTLADASKIKVPFMNRRGRYSYFEDDKVQAIEIPYADNKASMVIFLPAPAKEMTLFIQSFNFGDYQRIITMLQSSEVQVSVPKFQTTCKTNLNAELSRMGMPLAFTINADFSGMTGLKDLCISDVIHQAFVDVNEQGTEAGASTAVIMTLTAVRNPVESKIFNADHPFLFIIKENSTGNILFIGKVMNPKVK